MIDIKRRQILFKALISSAALGLYGKNSASADISSEPTLDSGLSRELLAVFDQWVEMGLGDPVEHLPSIEVDLIDEVTLRRKIAADFENDKLFVVDGLVLSFTEAIIMSNFGLAVASSNRENISAAQYQLVLV